ncbi:MAG: hypothetical protein Q8P83_03150 [bacterium]|nr:hypothetical protein [bacterium]
MDPKQDREMVDPLTLSGSISQLFRSEVQLQVERLRTNEDELIRRIYFILQELDARPATVAEVADILDRLLWKAAKTSLYR